jgi:WD40 repeat protein
MSAVDTIRDVSPLDSPYVGLNFYTQENAAIFFGRDNERTVLISNLRASRLTLLYAKSGTGKSSLLRAGAAAGLAELAQRSFTQRGTARNIPVVFSSWQDDPTAALIGEIHEAISSFLPAASPPMPAPDRLDAAIEVASRATDATLLVILDQFEEYLLYRSRDMRDRPFADELAACINRADLRANFLISIREDAYFALGDLFKGRISNVYGNYFHLEHLTREAAREAIQKPIHSFNKLHLDQVPVQIEPGLVDAVLDQFTPDQLAPDQGGVGRLAEGNGAEPHRDEVEASYLQLVMKRLWDIELERRSRKLRLETLEELGGAQTIVRTHVDRALGDLPDEEREAAVAILVHLVTPSRTKIALAAADLAEYTGLPAEETNALLQRLAGSDTRILRPVPPPPGQTDGTRFEISHDLLAPAILDWGSRHKAVRLEHEKEAAERQARAEKKLALRYRRTATIAVVVAALLVVTTILAILAVSAERAAVNRSHLAQSDGMAAEAMNLLPVNGPLAMLLSLQAYETAPTLQADSALIQAVQQPLDDRLVSGGSVASVAFSPDGHTLAAGDGGGHVGLWDVATGRRTGTLAEHSPVDSVAFSPDGHTLAAGDGAGDVGLWDAATGQRTGTLAEGSPVASVAFSRDGRTLAVGDGSGTVRLWDVTTRQSQWSLMLSGGSPVDSVAFSRDGRTLAFGNISGFVYLSDAATPLLKASLAEGSRVGSVAFSPDGHTLAVGNYGGHVDLWDAASLHRTATLAEGSLVGSVAFSPDGHTLAVGNYGGHVDLWEAATGQRTATFAEGSIVYDVAFSPDGHTLAAGDGAGDVSLRDVATGQRTATLAEHSPIDSVAFSPDGHTLAVGDGAGDVGLWDAATGQRTATLAEHSPVASVAFSPDGHILAVGDYGGNVGLWDAATGQRTAILAERSRVDSVAFSPDGHTLAVGDGGGHVSLWDVVTRQTTVVLLTGNVVYGVAFSPDGHTLAAGDGGGHVNLWYAATGQRTATLAEHSPVASVAFSPDGTTVATGDSQGNVGILNAANGQRLANLTAGDVVTSLAFSSDGRVLAIGGLNGDIVLQWQNLANLTQHYFMQLICGKVQGNITQAQWADYAPGQPYQRTCPQ